MDKMSTVLGGIGLAEWHVASTWPLLLFPLAFLPFFYQRYKAFDHPSLTNLPEDVLSIWLAKLWRLLVGVALASTSIALSQPYLTEQQEEKVGQGAHIMVVLDRSGSMNDEFGQHTSKQTLVKMEAARRVLKDFIQQSKDDLIGMVAFSTSPILVAPLTHDRDYVYSALEATEAGGMGFTAVARGLGMALDLFEGKPVTGSRAILLVSDGGAHLDGKTQDMLRAMFIRHNASLYWVYLRSKNGASLKQAPSEEEGIDAYPEYALHEYFKTLNVPYKVYEAENAQEVKAAIHDISILKNKPTRYLEPVAKRDMAGVFYAIAWLCCLGLFFLHAMEVKEWKRS